MGSRAASSIQLDRLRDWLEPSYVPSLAPSTSLVVLDIDRTDDPAHGAHEAQEQVAFHGFHDPHMDHPRLVFDGETGQLVTALLRPGRAHAAARRRDDPRAADPRLLPSPCGSCSTAPLMAWRMRARRAVPGEGPAVLRR